MASVEPPFSDGFAQIARDEAERLSIEATRRRLRGEQWIDRGARLLQEAEELEGRVRDLDEMLGRAPQLRLDLQTRALQGTALRQAANEILLQKRGLRTPIHYKEWYGLLAEEGVVATGKDPVATFLTQITRSPVVRRVESGSGVYELDPHGAYEQAQSEVVEATREVALRADLRSSDEAASREFVQQAQARLDQARERLRAVLQARSLLLHVRMTAHTR